MAGDHFYTTSRVERDNAFAFLDYLEEGTACFVFDAPSTGTTPFYRCYNPVTGDHFYTTSQPEASNAIDSLAYQAEGVACYVFDAAGPGTVPLYRLLNSKSGDHLYTTSRMEANNAVFSFGYQWELTACHVFDSGVMGTVPLYRLVQATVSPNPNATQSPWAVLLCKFKGDTFEPPAAAGVTAFRTVCEQFFTQANNTFNAVKFFSDVSHGKLDLSGSQVLGWYEIDASITGTTPQGDPILSKSQAAIVGLARQAAKDAGVAIDKFAGVVVIMNRMTGWAQGTPGWMAADWRRVDGRNPDGTLGARNPGGNGVEVFGQEMGHGYGLDHSRMQGSNADYQDQWDIMSTVGSTFGAADPNYAARGPGLNAWNMRSRGWLDESRIWKAPSNADFSQTIQLRPLHQRTLPGFLGAELPGIGTDSAYLVEFRVPELWDAGFPSATVLVHRFSGEEENGQLYSPGLLGQSLKTHSYIMPSSTGGFSFSDGDIFKVGTVPFTRMKVLGIDPANRVATIQVCYSSAPIAPPTVKIKADASSNSCAPVLVESAVVTFKLAITGLQCSQSYSAMWTVAGANPVPGQQKNAAKFSVTLPGPTIGVTVSVTVTLDDGAVVSDSLQFNPLSVSEASLQEFICNLRRERMKPIPWWEWEPERLRAAMAIYSREELVQTVRLMDQALQRLKTI
jgi:Repeat of unknown function (DUF5648)